MLCKSSSNAQPVVDISIELWDQDVLLYGSLDSFQ